MQLRNELKIFLKEHFHFHKPKAQVVCRLIFNGHHLLSKEIKTHLCNETTMTIRWEINLALVFLSCASA